MDLILVGDDGSRAATHALEWATRLADERGARVVAIHVVAPGEVTQFTDRPPTVVVRHSQPSSAIMAAAEDRDVDLIVLGRRGSGGFPSLPIGTTTHHVAAASGRPIAVVPSVVTATSDRLVERVIVGLDGLQGSAEAAAWSAQQWPDARFTAVHVVELAPVLTQLDDDGAGAEFHERAFARAHSLLRDHWSRPLREAGVAFNVSVKEGGPAEMLLDMAARVEADLLVVGRRGDYPLRGTLGGVSQRVLAYAPCPAVITPSLP